MEKRQNSPARRRGLKKYCEGCEEDFYNNHNPYGIEECWHLRAAKIIWRKRVHIDERPPWKAKAERMLDCYRQKRFVFVRPEVNG